MAKRKKGIKKTKKGRIIVSSILLLLTAVFGAFALYNFSFFGKIYPGVYVAGIDVGGKTPTEAARILAERVPAPEYLILEYGDKEFKIDPVKVGVQYDFPASSKRAYEVDRSQNILFDFVSRLKAPFRKVALGLIVYPNEETLTQELSVVAKAVGEPPVSPSIKLVGGEIAVNRGKAGKEVDATRLRALIGQALALANSSPIAIPVEPIDTTLSESEAVQAKDRGQKLVNKSLTFNFEYQKFTYKGSDILALIDPKSGYNEEQIGKEIGDIAQSVNRDPKNPIFTFTEGKVQEFVPATDGVRVQTDALQDAFIQNLPKLEGGETSSLALDIPVVTSPPQYRTEEVNNLGIKELLGRGVSSFRGSIPSRVYNITLAAGRVNGILVPPGETFSFVNTLGDISALTGYQQAYIIQDGRTILGDGGGVCQVSTTFFRAALAAGLPIIERRAHSYRVGYYEQGSPVGFDATVYYPTTDLKVKNDTPAHILVQSFVDTKKSMLVFEIYGTSDGRVATTTKPTVANQVEPPPDVYQDDPTLPAGKIKQVDYRAWGAKVTFSYKVTRGTETIYQKTFVSNYLPWRAVYLRGTGQ